MSRLDGPQLINAHAGRQQNAYIRRMQVCDLLARIWLCEGWQPIGKLFLKSYDTVLIKKYWQFSSSYPYPSEFTNNIVSAKHVLWYIRTQMEHSPIWNGSFYNGLAQAGKIGCKKSGFPYVMVWSSKRWRTILRASPLPVNLCEYSSNYPQRWGNALHLVLPHDENSFSFMAGVLASGVPVLVSDLLYASYPPSCEPWLRKWHIPIERVVNANQKIRHNKFLIAPVWPAMLEAYMPRIATGWLTKHQLSPQSVLYASILWCVHKHAPFDHIDVIPYLPHGDTSSELFKTETLSRRENLERKWVELGLNNLDDRFKKIVMATRTR